MDEYMECRNVAAGVMVLTFIYTVSSNFDAIGLYTQLHNSILIVVRGFGYFHTKHN